MPVICDTRFKILSKLSLSLHSYEIGMVQIRNIQQIREKLGER